MSAREVELSGGAPWGFRMHGGADQNQPLRISRVNPGRKASLSGIREGDVITSINGRPTKDMSNSDAHGMLRSAGPTLRLGLNEDREMSPRRRSIGKASELKRPSQLISDLNTERATPQAPVYATIRPPNSPHNKLQQSPIRSLNSPMTTLNSTPLVKNLTAEEPIKFHPTNPFYSTLPSNYMNSSKLPIPNGKPHHLNSMHSSKIFNNNDHDLKMSSFFSKKFDSGPSSIPTLQTNNIENKPPTSDTNPMYNSNSDKQFRQEFKSERNPFENIKNNGLQSHFIHSDDEINYTPTNGTKSMNYSKSDSNFHCKEEVIKQSTVTERKINEIEEIKTVKKITLNGSGDDDHSKESILNTSQSNFSFTSADGSPSQKERIIFTTVEKKDDTTSRMESSKKNMHEQEFSSKQSFKSQGQDFRIGAEETHIAEKFECRPPVKTASTPSLVSTPPNKPVSGSSSNQTEEIINYDNIQSSPINESDSNETKQESLNKNTIEHVKSSDETKLENDSCLTETYIVEIPNQAPKNKPKLNNELKSKSCDNDDTPIIVEITEESNVQSDNQRIIITESDSNNAIITSEENDVEWEKADDFNPIQTELIKGTMSNSSIPLNVAHCEETKLLSPEEELSLRNYLKTLNLSTNPSTFESGDIKMEIENIINREVKYRLRRKGLAEDYLFQRAGPSRSLAVIDEEGSGDSSKTSRRHSYLSDKKSDNEELEDDVFESKEEQHYKNRENKLLPSKNLIPQPCVRVDAKLKEPEISEARGTWTMQTVEKMAGAELVYLTDSSSSTSSVYDVNDDTEKCEDTDTSIRMITPTIEVTDAETYFCNSYLSTDKTTSDSKDSSSGNIHQYNFQSQNSKNLITDNEKQDDFKNEVSCLTNDSSHEIVVLSTDDIHTNLFVKDIEKHDEKTESQNNDNMIKFDSISNNNCIKNSKDIDNYDLEIKVLKCELNDAINNLIKEVTSDSENSIDLSKENILRQDSSSSLESSQCTAKYNPTFSSLNDVSNILHDDANDTKDSLQKSSSHVKDILNKIVDTSNESNNIRESPLSLRDICLKTISSFPFGNKILEELANVSARLQNLSVIATESNQITSLKNHIKGCESVTNDSNLSKNVSVKTSKSCKDRDGVPPPIQPRKSSLKKTHEEKSSPIVPCRKDRKYECLSPSQKMLMEKTNTIIEKEEIMQDIRVKNDVKSEKDQGKCNETILKQSRLPTTSLKSETGSRLLALIRDSSASTSLAKTKAHSEQTIPVVNKESFSKRLLNEIDSSNFDESMWSKKKDSILFSNNFKPIPPPKPVHLKKSYYESDSENYNSSDNSFRKLATRKYFHYSTGNLSKEIENDVSSIQSMHRYCTNLREQNNDISSPRRPSLPKDLCDQQMEYIRKKEIEVEAELQRLEREKNISSRRGPRAPMIKDMENFNTEMLKFNNTHKGSTPTNHEKRRLSLFSSSQEELLREKMYTEYISQMAEREHRKQQKVIKVTHLPLDYLVTSKSTPAIDFIDSKVNNRIEQEFISKARERWDKLGIKDPETEDEKEPKNDVYREPKIIEHKIKVIEAGEEKDVQKLPSHMQEFVKFTVNNKEEGTSSPGESDSEQRSAHVVVLCAVVILVLTVSKFLLRLLRNK